MIYNSFILTNPSQSVIETEISFSVASARAEKVDFLKLVLPDVDGEKITNFATKTLKSLKKQGRIELYIFSADLDGNSTEAEYLKNKFPEINSACNINEASLIVKI